MRIETPSLRADGFKVDLNTGYGNPWGDILLTEDGRTRLQWVNEDDCDRIIKAAAELKSQIIASRTQAAAPHGRRHMFKDRCQLCGKPEDDELHAEPVINQLDERVAGHPVGSCGHSVTPGADAAGYGVCRECLSDPVAVALYDRATAGEQLPQAKS